MSIESLNPAQREAVTTSDGPALVLAGAGSGKTRVIVERIVWLIAEEGVDPRNILALTFTNRAAKEMKERAARRLSMERFSVWLGTFHSFGLFLLRREIDELGRKKNFTVFDDSDQLSLMKRLVKELPEGDRVVTPREALGLISSWKVALEAPSFDHEDEQDRIMKKLWSRYHQCLEGINAVDFDDLLVLPARLLTENEELRQRYKNRYRHVLVDEYQDTNHAQYEIVRLLCGENGNVFVVGDEDQSIYSWRGADISNILDFAQDFPGARVFRLEQNYRSTAAILKTANAVVANNTQRLGKNLWTAREGGDPVRVYKAMSAEDEADFIVESIADNKLSLNGVAILYRTNGQARLLEEALRKKGMPYRVFAGIRFYSRKEIKDVLAYLRLLVNRRDDESLRRIINVPARGIGPTSLALIVERAEARGTPLVQTLREMENDQRLPARARTSIQAFLELLDSCTEDSKKKGVRRIVERILDETGYREYVRISDEKDFRTRLEMLDEFLEACGEADGKSGTALETFLQDMALLTDVDDWDPGTEAVTLMTCHSAKGLEFDDVYLAGLEEGLLPHASALDSKEEIEEERRICYVSMTRAKTTLTLTYAASRRIYGEVRDCEASRFLDEIPEGFPDVAKAVDGATEKGRKRQRGVREGLALKMGTRVRHASLGLGTVMYTRGSGEKMRAKIRFQTGRAREFMVNQTPLEILEVKKA